MAPKPDVVAVVGSRDYPRLDLVRVAVRNLHPDATVLSGGARGVDRTAIQEAKALGRKFEVIPADWNRFGKAAGFNRNERIAERCTHMVAFWDGNSAGTRHVVWHAAAKRRKVTLYGPEGSSVNGVKAKDVHDLEGKED